MVFLRNRRAKERHQTVAGWARGIQEQSARAFTIERVSVVALTRLPVIEMSLAPRSLEVIERCSVHGPASAAQTARELVPEARLTGGGEAVDRDAESMIAE